MVKNAATGAPLPRALVQLAGTEPALAALTDSDGRFEIPGVPAGTQAVQVIKPGYHDLAPNPSFPGTLLENTAARLHNLFVTAEMPDLAFTLTPANVIRGQVELTTGDPAQGIDLILLQRGIQQGRAIWHATGFAHTNSDGVYRFAGLDDGVYAVLTQPAMENDTAGNLLEAGSDANAPRNGFPAMYYPDATEFQGAAKIQVAGGQQAQANFTLAPEPFYVVRAQVRTPSQGQASADRNSAGYTAAVLDAQGRQLAYPAQYDAASRTVQAMLPNGSYTLRVSAMTANGLGWAIFGGTTPSDRRDFPMAGQAVVSVTSHAIPDARVVLGPAPSGMVQTDVLRSGVRPPGANRGDNLFIAMEQAGAPTDGMTAQFAQGTAPGAIESTVLAPGLYWLHTTAVGLCENSFTASGAALAREPLIVGPGGAVGPLILTLRDDCAALKVSLPGTLAAMAGGEEPDFTVYVVPDFDSTADVTPMTLRYPAVVSATAENLTPGNYHVYTFAAPVAFEYRNPAAIAALPNPGQAVTLQPGVTANLILEAPQP